MISAIAVIAVIVCTLQNINLSHSPFGEKVMGSSLLKHQLEGWRKGSWMRNRKILYSVLWVEDKKLFYNLLISKRLWPSGQGLAYIWNEQQLRNALAIRKPGLIGTNYINAAMRLCDDSELIESYFPPHRCGTRLEYKTDRKRRVYSGCGPLAYRRRSQPHQQPRLLSLVQTSRLQRWGWVLYDWEASHFSSSTSPQPELLSLAIGSQPRVLFSLRDDTIAKAKDVFVVETLADPDSPGRGALRVTSMDQSGHTLTSSLGQYSHLFDSGWHIICFGGRLGRYWSTLWLLTSPNWSVINTPQPS